MLWLYSKLIYQPSNHPPDTSTRHIHQTLAALFQIQNASNALSYSPIVIRIKGCTVKANFSYFQDNCSCCLRQSSTRSNGLEEWFASYIRLRQAKKSLKWSLCTPNCIYMSGLELIQPSSANMGYPTLLSLSSSASH